MAAKRILGCYPEIPASDKQVFISGLIEMLLLYPPAVVNLASSPAQGIPSKLKFLSLAEIRGLLDELGFENAERERRIARARPDAQRISYHYDPQPGDCANMFVPEGHSRYSRLVEWTRSPGAHPRKWRFGRANDRGHVSDTRSGLWVSWDVWDSGPSPAPTLGRLATPTVEELKKIYAKPAIEAAE